MGGILQGGGAKGLLRDLGVATGGMINRRCYCGQMIERLRSVSEFEMLIDLCCKPDVAVPHEFHGGTGMHAAACKKRPERVAQAMKVHRAPPVVLFGDSGEFQVLVEHTQRWRFGDELLVRR